MPLRETSPLSHSGALLETLTAASLTTQLPKPVLEQLVDKETSLVKASLALHPLLPSFPAIKLELDEQAALVKPVWVSIKLAIRLVSKLNTVCCFSRLISNAGRRVSTTTKAQASPPAVQTSPWSSSYQSHSPPTTLSNRSNLAGVSQMGRSPWFGDFGPSSGSPVSSVMRSPTGPRGQRSGDDLGLQFGSLNMKRDDGSK